VRARREPRVSTGHLESSRHRGSRNVGRCWCRKWLFEEPRAGLTGPERQVAGTLERKHRAQGLPGVGAVAVQRNRLSCRSSDRCTKMNVVATHHSRASTPTQQWRTMWLAARTKATTPTPLMLPGPLAPRDGKGARGNGVMGTLQPLRGLSKGCVDTPLRVSLRHLEARVQARLPNDRIVSVRFPHTPLFLREI
jgi:hypothetical protein